MSLWINEPYILIEPTKIMELWPFEEMKSYDKINAITRMIIILSIIEIINSNAYYN